MTLIDAIEIITNSKEMQCDCDECTKKRFAFNLAIYALRKQLKTVTCDVCKFSKSVGNRSKCTFFEDYTDGEGFCHRGEI